ncbi:MAG: hypothetical protein HN712_17130 [Gemmatimonadetes bacterium]|jgi:hypothetical protein|nr:hypothetical protein [Gemmatimonadota bacterium]MBT7862042.1 hypothetical protein [Gemmatimonadota bacterium]
MKSASAARSPFTLRAFIVGSLLAIFLAFACPYTVFLHHTAGMAADFITAGAIFLFFLLTFIVNSLLRLVRAGLALQPGELILVYTMMIVASAIPTWGLIANLLPVLPGAYYYATPENNWAGIIHPFIPRWASPQSPVAIKYFFEGLPLGETIPWEAWVKPLSMWLILIVAIYAAMMSCMVIIRRQWIEHERLVFPLTQLPLEMIGRGDSDGPSVVSRLFRSPLLWIGFALPFIVFSTHGLSRYYNFVTPIDVEHVFYLFRTTPIRIFLSFPVLGFVYFVNLEIAFSLWFFHLVARSQSLIFNIVGFELPGHGETFTGAFGGTSPAVSHQAMGAMAVLVLFGLWTSRRHLRDVFRRAVYGDPDVDDSREAMSYRSALSMLLVSTLVIGVWLFASGMPIWAIPFFLTAAFFTFFGLARIIAEAGVGFCRAQMVAPIFSVYSLGSESLGHSGLVSMGLTYTWSVDIRTSVMASTINGLKLADALGIERPRRLLLGAAIAAGLSLVTAALTTLWLAYTYGGINLQGWFFGGMPQTVFGFVADKINTPLTEQVIVPRWLFTGVGTIVMAGLMSLRQQIVSWPLHYIGFPIGDTWVMSWVWFSIFLGWLLKLVILRYWGVPGYRAFRPFFLGLVLGQISCAGTWMIIDVCTGMVGNYIHIGVP